MFVLPSPRVTPRDAAAGEDPGGGDLRRVGAVEPLTDDVGAGLKRRVQRRDDGHHVPGLLVVHGSELARHAALIDVVGAGRGSSCEDADDAEECAEYR
jgi:hypothetical protein